MLYQFNHKVLTSFYLWFENKLLSSKMKAYDTDVANQFVYVEPADSAGNWLSYQGYYRQLVAEENVDKVNSGVFINGSFTSGDSSDIYIDYNDGRVIVPSASGQSLSITANSTIKEVNTYLVNDSPESILMDSEFVLQGQSRPYSSTQTGKLNDKTYVVPACFISVENTTNEAFCFGGEDETTVRVRVFVVAPNSQMGNYIRDGILSAFADTEREDIRLISSQTDFPYGVFFSLKSYPYNYTNLVAAQPTVSANRAYIKNVYASKVAREFTEDFNKSFIFGFLDFDLITARFPRI